VVDTLVVKVRVKVDVEALLGSTAPARVRKAVSITTKVLLNHLLGLRVSAINPFVVPQIVAKHL
jgi:hypothetical protein